MHHWRVVAIVSVAVIGAVLIARHLTNPSTDDLLREAKKLILRQDFAEAEALAARVLSQDLPSGQNIPLTRNVHLLRGLRLESN